VKKVIHNLKEKNKSILITSHDWHLVSEICDRVGVIHQGRIIKELTVSAYKEKNYFTRDLKDIFDSLS